MERFKLIKRMVIKFPRMDVQRNCCYLYNFKEAGITSRELCRSLAGNCMDIYKYTGVIRASMKVCPWCRQKCPSHEHLTKHICQVHNKCGDSNLHEFRMQTDLYRLLLSYCRNGNYDALAFLTQSSCEFCVVPEVVDREGKCSMPVSSRNKMRSFKLLRFKCQGFNWKDYNHIHCAITYRRRPVKV